MSKLICVTSRALCPSPFLPRLEDIARSGAGAILLREKDLSPKEYASLARPVLALCRRAGIPCILHGHPKAALALGADACILARPYVTAVYGGGAEGVRLLTEKLKAELADTMAMCGAHSLADISRSMLYGF